MYLVVEWTTISAPNSMGRQRMGVAKVLSTMSGRPLRCATRANFSMSNTVSAGLASVSPNTALVLGWMAASISSSVASASTQMQWMPNFSSVTENRLTVPP